MKNASANKLNYNYTQNICWINKD